MKKGLFLGSALVIFFFAFLLALLGLVFYVLLTPNAEQANQVIEAQQSGLETERVLLGLLRQPLGDLTVAEAIIKSAKTGNYAELDQRMRKSLDSAYADAKCRTNVPAPGCAWKIVIRKGGKEVHSLALEETETLAQDAKAQLPGNIEIELAVYTKVQPLELGQ